MERFLSAPNDAKGTESLHLCEKPWQRLPGEVNRLKQLEVKTVIRDGTFVAAKKAGNA